VGEGVVVIGVGNRDRGDDAAGRRVAAALRASVPEGVFVLESDGDPATIMDAWEGAALAVVVDAMVSGAAPGTVRRFDVTDDPIPISVDLTSTHGLGAVEGIELARELDRLPDRLLVYGIEGLSFRSGDPLSAEVEGGVEVATSMVLAEVGDA
jgi:hydrogenase maturation protease